MPELPICERPQPQRAAAIDQAFAGITPAERTGPTLLQQLRSIRTLLAKKRQQGFTVEQICASLKHPAVGIDASPVSVRRIIAEADERRDQRRKARAAKLLGGIRLAPTAAPAATPTAART